MGIIETLLIALALAMDAFAVSITCGICGKSINVFKMLKVAIFFAAFQTIMPIIGFTVGDIIPFNIEDFDHWLAFVLLALIGGHMIKESFDKDEECDIKKDVFKTTTLILAAIATSIDALAAGFSVSILKSGISLLAISAGLITLITSFCGVVIGKKFGHIFEKKIELISGSVLILIGLKILIEHLFLM